MHRILLILATSTTLTACGLLPRDYNDVGPGDCYGLGNKLCRDKGYRAPDDDYMHPAPTIDQLMRGQPRPPTAPRESAKPPSGRFFSCALPCHFRQPIDKTAYRRHQPAILVIERGERQRLRRPFRQDARQACRQHGYIRQQRNARA